jgi:hypothetical protein|tara:strand:+ start:7317 stop:7535 length:219 start_codon:yes stop_codon:yes gene_type:complete
MKEKKNKKFEEFVKKIEEFKSKDQKPKEEAEVSPLLTEKKLVRENVNTNVFLNLYGEETYKKIMEKFKNIKK